VQLDFLVPGADQVVDDVGGGGVAAGAAEPLVAGQALYDAGGIVYAAVAGGELSVNGARA
jgi:hypothetical protein